MWQLIPGQALRYRTWDGEAFVLYNDLSGDTHLLDAAAMEVLSALRAGAASGAQLGAALQLDGDPDCLAQLDALLGELRRQALVEPVAC